MISSNRCWGVALGIRKFSGDFVLWPFFLVMGGDVDLDADMFSLVMLFLSTAFLLLCF